MAVSKKYVE